LALELTTNAIIPTGGTTSPIDTISIDIAAARNAPSAPTSVGVAAPV